MAARGKGVVVARGDEGGWTTGQGRAETLKRFGTGSRTVAYLAPSAGWVENELQYARRPRKTPGFRLSTTRPRQRRTERREKRSTYTFEPRVLNMDHGGLILTLALSLNVYTILLIRSLNMSITRSSLYTKRLFYL